jgi:MinD-like ATPase involved in chromosome partitioning or flagellar assembly
MNPPRLALLVSTHRLAQRLLPTLQQSHFALVHHCLEPEQLFDAVEAGEVDLALVSTGPRGLDATALADLVRRRIPLVVLDDQPHHPRWAAFSGVVLLPQASLDLVLRGLDAALRGEPMRQPAQRPVQAETSATGPLGDVAEPAVELPPIGDPARDGPRVLTVIGGRGAPGRTTLALNLAAVLSQVASTALVDVDLNGALLAARLDANTAKNLATLAHHTSAGADWNVALGLDLQPVHQDCPRGWLLAGLPSPEGQVDAPFLEALLAALRARFQYVVCDTGVQWLDGDRAARVPIQQADQVLLVATPDVGGTRRARQALDRVRTLAGPLALGLVVNQHRAHQDYDRAQIEFTFGEPLSAVLPFDPNACWRALEHQRPVVFDGRSPLGRALVRFAERVHGGQVELPRPAAAPRQPVWWTGLLPQPARAWTQGGKSL